MLRYLPTELEDGQAVELLTARGATEADAKAFLQEWFAAGKLKIHPPAHPGGAQVVGVEQIEWGALQATFSVRISISRDPWSPAWSRRLTPWPTAFTVRRDDLLALIKRQLEFADPSQALQRAKQRGRKPHGETRDRAIREEIDRMLKAGEIPPRGETAAAKVIQKKLQTYDYAVDTIQRKIAEHRKAADK